MIIDIQAHGFDLSPQLEDYARRKMWSAFGKRFPRIREVQVRLSDINGPRGGADKCCRICIGLPHASAVVVEITEPGVYAAFSKALDIAAQTVNRKLSRQHARHLRGLPRPGRGAGDAQLSM